MLRVNKILKHEKYKAYIEKIKELEKERIFCCHNLQHFMDVARIGYVITLERSFKIEKEIIYAAALLHDIGRWKQYIDGTDHAMASADLSQVILRECEFDNKEVESIIQAIKKHRRGENLESPLDIVLYEADKASRLCLVCTSIGQCKKFTDKEEAVLLY